MRKITRYVAFDGTVFQSFTKCIEYETKNNFYASFTCIPFYDIDWINISNHLYDDPIGFRVHLYAFTAKNPLDVEKVKELFEALDLMTEGIDEPGEYHLSWTDHSWERSELNEEA